MIGIPKISIPAPVKGRTGLSAALIQRERISIPAPVKGRTEEAKEKAVLFEFQFPPP